MAKHFGKKFSWVIKNFSSLQSEECLYSDPVLIGDYEWRLRAFPKGDEDVDHFSLFLEVADLESLPSGWRRYVKFRLTIVPHDPEKDPVEEEGHCWFDKVSSCQGWPSMILPSKSTKSWGLSSLISLTKLHDKDEGFHVNGEIIIIAEVDVFEVIGTLDAPEKSKESSRPLKKIKLNDDCAESKESSSPLKKTKLNDDCVESNESLKEPSSVKESMVVNGFQVLPSQVEYVRHIFERHPDIAVDFRAKNHHLRTTCMNFLLSLIETLCKSLEELSNEDLEDADIALACLKDVNFKVDWLEKKLDQVKEKKEKEQSVLAKLQELDALAEKHKAELLATRTTLSFYDVV